MPARSMDPRTRRSRSALETALRELIAERDLSQISVSDITKRAGVNRSTFYEHYADVHDLAAAACTTVFDELVAASPTAVPPLNAEGSPTVDLLPELFAHVAEHAPLYRALLGDDGSARVINHLLHRMAIAAHVRRVPAETAEATEPTEATETAGATGTTEVAETLVRPAAGSSPSPAGGDPADNPHDPAATFVAGAVLGTVIDWLRRGCPGTPETMAAALWPLLTGTARAAGWGTEGPEAPTPTPTPAATSASTSTPPPSAG
ncbi:TetR/AcrR family transcriptional regulator [Streptomyces tauricus]|uniref:TetR/AcrR family transcriptional regulator n=1 Tax=Streptomyces tauricus TaxID=68274 RepID=UPI0038012ACE